MKQILLKSFYVVCGITFYSSVMATTHHVTHTVKYAATVHIKKTALKHSRQMSSAHALHSVKLIGHSGGGHGGDHSHSHDNSGQSSAHAPSAKQHMTSPTHKANSRDPICDSRHTAGCHKKPSKTSKQLTAKHHIKSIAAAPRQLSDQKNDYSDTQDASEAAIQPNDRLDAVDNIDRSENDTNRDATTTLLTSDYLTPTDPESNDVKTLIHEALNLSKKQLAYHFGSDNPNNGGMDCSGTISFLLKHLGMSTVPRQADEIYKWVWEKGKFFAVNAHHLDSFEFSHLRPGDLLFWTDTYQVDRDPPITHVMLYLGKDKQGKPLMFGASEGRGENNERLRGVRVFDFQLPKNTADHRARFIGYGTIPGIHYS